MRRRLILLATLGPSEVERIASALGPDVDVRTVGTLAELEAADVGPDTALLSFGTSVIVPAAQLGRFTCPTYNLHAASPEFPGRDPHHHAVFRRAKRYGATLHLMTEKVDDGPIVAVELFDVNGSPSPKDLLRAANEAGFRLIERLGPRLAEPDPLPGLPGVTWAAVKTRRSDLNAFSRLDILIGREEFEDRFRAFDGEGHDNLTVELHGRIFRIDKSDAPSRPAMENDFTEEAFRTLLRALTGSGYRFARYAAPCEGRHVLWRHDIDFSVHRAVRLAEIEREEGALATYFVNPRCRFYSILEPEIADRLRRIAAMGHDIGLHFDAEAVGRGPWSGEALAEAVDRERQVLEMLAGVPVHSVSWHNPELVGLIGIENDTVAGLVNAYGPRFRTAYTYCSDSNGHWRFRPMRDVIEQGAERLHLLTHPEWWTPTPITHRERVARAILGRARAALGSHRDALRRSGRTEPE